MLSLRLVVALLVLMAAAACGDSSSPPPTAPSPTPSPAPAPAPGGQTSSVTIPVGAAALGDRAFVPAELNVAVGTRVTWTNADPGVPHTSTSDAPAWDSGVVGSGGQFSRTFETPGTFPYHCTIHPGMRGTVVVR